MCQISRKKLLENQWNFSTAQTVLRCTQCQSFAPWSLFCSEISGCKPENFRFPQTAFERYDMLLVHDITINGNLKQSMRFDCKCAEQKQSFCNKNVQKADLRHSSDINPDNERRSRVDNKEMWWFVVITKMPYFELRESDFHQIALRRSPDWGLSADTSKRPGTNGISF